MLVSVLVFPSLLIPFIHFLWIILFSVVSGFHNSISPPVLVLFSMFLFFLLYYYYFSFSFFLFLDLFWFCEICTWLPKDLTWYNQWKYCLAKTCVGQILQANQEIQLMSSLPDNLIGWVQHSKSGLHPTYWLKSIDLIYIPGLTLQIILNKLLSTNVELVLS